MGIVILCFAAIYFVLKDKDFWNQLIALTQNYNGGDEYDIRICSHMGYNLGVV